MNTLYQTLRGQGPFFLLAGPCVIESRQLMLNTAEHLAKATQKRGIPFVFKSSFTKANRTSGESYSGPGLDEGLKILQEIKTTFNVPIVTDVHEPNQCAPVAQVADILQIPAFLSRQTELLTAAAHTNRIVNIKKAQFMAPEDMDAAAAKVSACNNYNILLTERGTSFGYHNLVVDFRSFAVMAQTNYPVVYDVTHSLQKPSINRTSGGTPEYVPMMARAALSTGLVRGLFLETHPNPSEALSDAASMFELEKVNQLLDELVHTCEIINYLRRP